MGFPQRNATFGLCLFVGLLVLAGCSEQQMDKAAIIVGALGLSALASANGGRAGSGRAFDPQRYGPERDARCNHPDGRR